MKHIRKENRLTAILLCILLLLACAAALASGAAESNVETARPSVNGRLHVEGTQLVDAAGTPVQLRGVSTHGLTWYPQFIDATLFRQVSEDWHCNLIRLAMYSTAYCGGEQEENFALMEQGIRAGIDADMYVLVDWHILEDANPNQNLDAAIGFFDRIASEYAGIPNLIFEICNEPNQDTDWSDVLRYSEQVIPVIRKYIPDAVIVVGTPEYDRNLGDALMRPLDFDNVMYVLHFYTATHHEGLRGELESAVNAGLPVFISECGICEASGDGTIDFASAVDWFTFLNKHKISYAVWSLSDKDESSAMFVPGFKPAETLRDEDLTLSGRWVRELIRGTDPAEIPVPAPTVEKGSTDRIRAWISDSLGPRKTDAVRSWLLFAAIAGGIVLPATLAVLLHRKTRAKKRKTYDDIYRDAAGAGAGKGRTLARICLVASTFLTLIYLCWRIVWSVPVDSGVPAVAGNLILLAVEILGFAESLVLYRNLMGLKKHPLPEIPEDAWPEVDLFIATYNEPTDLLRRTINGCCHLKYPDRSKVHIWVCDDNRRPEMRALAEEMGVGYFDRPDNKGAKAGNLNHALGLTSAPYLVTLDADMIVRSDFLLKTIPYFIDAELHQQNLPEEERLHLGLLQTPQAFYDPDVYQHALYSENRAPNEQDFFYRTIEPAKTATNSVIYGGSNTVLSRKAVEDIGGFYTGSITEDFATGLLIESAGYVSLALSEPLASGQSPHVYREHIKQRTRWGRGVIVTAKKLKIFRRKNLTLAQKINYWSSVVYWYSPIKNLIYLISPLLYAALAIPVFRCNWLEMLVFWLPMFIFQDLSLWLNSRGAISTKWSGIYETSLMPHMLIPILKESLGITLSQFKVTDKSARGGKREKDWKSMLPFIVLIVLSVIGLIRVLWIFNVTQTISVLILLFWIIRNLYFLIMAVFLVDGRDSDAENVKVYGAEPVQVRVAGKPYEGIATYLTEHKLTVFLDDSTELAVGDQAEVALSAENAQVSLKGVITDITFSRKSDARTQTIEILDFGDDRYEYWQLLYDRIPSLPQSLQRDFGVVTHLWQNIAHRVARTRKK